MRSKYLRNPKIHNNKTKKRHISAKESLTQCELGVVPNGWDKPFFLCIRFIIITLFDCEQNTRIGQQRPGIMSGASPKSSRYCSPVRHDHNHTLRLTTLP
ncbi:hypothetical protein NPIL_396691 [Nephila pilipes]|uniref:Uncharacterized protein n=1 Tax=Nephila pilipes TaxID=299642 RepID=A0A8X6N096_NEPPI|nr:hypothetical protein NPIL_396691 [Nephila pilipes]